MSLKGLPCGPEGPQKGRFQCEAELFALRAAMSGPGPTKRARLRPVVPQGQDGACMACAPQLEWVTDVGYSLKVQVLEGRLLCSPFFSILLCSPFSCILEDLHM